MKNHQLVYSLDTIDEAVQDLIMLMPDCDVFTFTGTLGAGKTTLIQAFLRACGIHEEIQSPTFSYFNEYGNAQGQTFYHFDVYRLKNKQEFLAAGFNEYLYVPNSWALIEWPEIIQSLLVKKVCNITIDHHGEDRRLLRYFIK